MNISPFLTLNHSCASSLQWTSEQLLQAGLRAVQTFDLHAARAGLHDCPCPHHGTEDCDCQMVILLVYGDAPEPATLILHGNDGQAWLSIAEAPGQKPHSKTMTAIRQALEVNEPVACPKSI